MLIGQNGFRKFGACASLVGGQPIAIEESAGQAIDLLLYCGIAEEEKGFGVIPSEIAVKLLKCIEPVEVSSSRMNDDVVSGSELRPIDLSKRTAEQDDGILTYLRRGESSGASVDSVRLDGDVK
jgi:hypothetical protein